LSIIILIFVPNKSVTEIEILSSLARVKLMVDLLENGFGLTHLNPRPWEDYICPESSNFTYDVKKMLRDFNEIEQLKKIDENNVVKGIDEPIIAETIEYIINP
jgi:hypothetical protein